jgi:hypothetical protein
MRFLHLRPWVVVTEQALLDPIKGPNPALNPALTPFIVPPSVSQDNIDPTEK